MSNRLDGKVAIISGSSGGIGLAIATKLYENGASIVLNGRKLEKLQTIEKKLKGQFSKSQNATIQLVEADLSNEKGTDALIKQAPYCDILINNMGIYEPKNFEEITDADWQRMWDTNVMSGIRLSRHYFKEMKRKNWGRILFISSESAVQIPKEMIHYGTSKLAQIGIARGIAELTVGTQITSNSILVGPTYSEGVQTFIEAMASKLNLSIKEAETSFFEKIRPSSLIKRFITPEEIANLAYFLSSDDASAINGAAIRADGGVVRTII